MQNILKVFLGYDFEKSTRTGRLHNIGLSTHLVNMGWKIISPGDKSKFKYWTSISNYIMQNKVVCQYWMPSYKVVLFLTPIIFISRNSFFLGLRDLWFGNPQPIKSLKGRLFNKLGFYVFFFLDRFCNVKWIVISNEMKSDLIKFHPFINENNVIISSTGVSKKINKIKFNNDIKYDIGYFGTFDKQMDYIKYQELKTKFNFVHYGINDFDNNDVDGYITDMKKLDNEIDKCKFLVIFGVDDYSRLNRKVFYFLETEKPILYFGPKNNVTHRILSSFKGVFFNLELEAIKSISHQAIKYDRNINEFYYESISKKLDEDICNS